MSRHRAAEAVTHPIAVGPLPRAARARHRSPGRSALRHGAVAVGITGTALAAIAPASLQIPDAAATTASFALPSDDATATGAVVSTVAATPAAASADLRRATDRGRATLPAAVPAVVSPTVTPGDDTGDGGGDGRAATDCGASGSYGGVKAPVKEVGNAIECVWPGHEILGVGSRSNHSDHPGGYALDVMTTDGDAIASCLTENSDALGISYVIWNQRIDTGRGWKRMEDRGGDTANHKDHVHISFRHGASPDVSVLASCR